MRQKKDRFVFKMFKEHCEKLYISNGWIPFPLLILGNCQKKGGVKTVPQKIVNLRVSGSRPKKKKNIIVKIFINKEIIVNFYKQSIIPTTASKQ